MTTTALKNQFAIRHTTATTVLARAWATISLWRERARQRTHLSEMSAAMLKDIGVNVSQARAESGKPFWIH